MKTIGILGGLGPQATIDFEERIHAVSHKLIPQKFSTGYPPLITYYFRSPPIRQKPDGSFYDPVLVNPDLLKTAKKLSTLADVLVIPSNTPHYFIPELKKAFGKKIISIVDVTVEEIKRRKPKKVGVIAVGLTVKNGLFQKRVERLKIPWITIPEELAKKLDVTIFQVMEGRDPMTISTTAKQSVTFLRREGADQIILGCTEIPLLLGKYADEPDLINPAQLLAEKVVEFAIS